MDLSKLSSKELSDYQQAGQYTYPVIDLYIAQNTAPASQKYSRKELQCMSEDYVQKFAEIFHIPLNDPYIIDRIIRILRFKDALLDDIMFTYPINLEISEVICARLRQDCLATKITNSECTSLSKKVSASLIRIAATRIFAEPAQSIIELPVNSLDSYSEVKVGKFGLGFFSIIYWLLTSPKSATSLKIDSTHLDPTGELRRWIGIITPDLKINISEVPPKTLTGTEIILYGNLPINDMYLQLQKLRDVNFATITVNGTMINSTPNKNPVLIQLLPSGISVTDYAKGISLADLFGSLLIPSISTKKISSFELIPKVNPKTRIIPGVNRFTILVGEIAVVDLPYNGLGLNYIVQMDIKTPLPVSRDDILLEYPSVREEFILNVKELLRQALEINPKLYPLGLFRALKVYASPYIHNLSSELENSLINWRKVPYSGLDYYQLLNNSNLLVAVDNILEFSVEDLFISENNWDKDLFYGKHVRWVDLETSSANSSRLIFLNEKYRNQMSTWKVDISVALGTLHLLPKNISTNTNNLYHKYLRKFGKLYSLGYNLLSSFDGLNTYYLVDRFTISNLADNIQKIINVDTNLAENIISIYLNTFSTLRPEVAYGFRKPELFTPRIVFEFNVPVYLVPKFKNIFQDVMMNILKYSNETLSLGFTLELFSELGKTTFLINLAKTGLEYVFLKSIQNVIQNDEAPLVLDYWKYFLNNSNREQILWKHVSYIIPRNTFEVYIEKPIELFVEVYRSTREIIHSLPHITQSIKPEGPEYKFTLGSLLDYIYRFPLEPKDFLLEIPKISKWDLKAPLQVLEIAINEGTTKPAILATITETYQNSLDAIRQSGYGKIQITVTRTNNFINYQIYDPIGIPPEGLLALSIPFLSTKIPSELVTGEMGSGFFNVYRKAVSVMIQTGNVWIRDVPIKKDYRVIDIERSLIQTSEYKKGSTIVILWETDKVSETLTEIIGFIRNVLPLSNPLELNGREQIITKEPFLIYDVFTMYQIKEHISSYILTKGIPFSDLFPYFSDLVPYYIQGELEIGFVLDIKHGGYTPVQSRNKINIPGQDKLKNFFEMVAYISGLKRQEAHPELNLLKGYSFDGDMNQVLPLSMGVISNFNTFLLYYEFPGNESLASTIVKLHDKLNDPVFVNNYLNSHLPLPFLQKIVRQWFVNKNKNIKQNYIPENVEVSPNLIRFTQKFIEIYWSNLQKLNIPEINSGPIPKFEWSELPYGTVGFYQAKIHTITLNTKYAIEIPEILTEEIVLDIFRYKGRDLFGYQFPASTLVHELSHVWSHIQGHNDYYLTIDGKTQLYTFDQAANVVYQKILELGFVKYII